MNRLNPLRVGLATALTFAVLSLVCALAVALFPDGTVAYVNSWTHGLDLNVLRVSRPMTLGSVVLGLVNVSIFGFVIGAVFSACYNLVNLHRN